MTEISDLGLMDRVERNIERILAQNEQLREENRKFAAERTKLGSVLNERNDRIAELQNQVDQLLLHRSVTEVSGGVRAAKLRINRLLKDVDRCIALMNK